jgi:phage N-6-adenine-methyltransferase
MEFSKEIDSWYTPQYLYDELNKEFNFTLDPCASDFNHKCDKYYTEKEDGLAQNWDGERVYMNPPYDKSIAKWVRKASSAKALVVCLLPVRTDTQWWHDHIIKPQREVRFIKGRLKFGGRTDVARFPSAIVIFRNS